MKMDVRFMQGEKDCFLKSLESILSKESISGLENTINTISCEGISFSFYDFVFHSLFSKLGTGRFNSRKDIEELATRHVPSFESYFLEADNTLKRYNHIATPEIEAEGVAGTLIVANMIFGLSEPDWKIIKITNKKTNDFQITGQASNGSFFIEVECKGIEEYTASETQALITKNEKIKEKKSYQRNEKNNPAVMLGGIVTTPQKDESGNAICWLVDPPAGEFLDDPFFFKLRSRLHFYHNNVKAIAHYHFLIALSNRIKALEAIVKQDGKSGDYKKLDGVYLQGMSGKKFSTPSFDNRSLAFVYNSNGDNTKSPFAFGEVIPYKRGEKMFFLFYGLDPEVLEILINQNFQKICTYNMKEELRGIKCSIIARIPQETMDEIEFNYPDNSLNKITKRIEIHMNGVLYSTRAGRVIGIVSQNEGEDFDF